MRDPAVEGRKPVRTAASEPTGGDGRTASGGLTRQLGLWSAVGIVVGCTIGSGIFRVPSVVAAETGSAAGIAAVWVIGGVLSLFGALTLAELATQHPSSGGIYVFLREAYGPRIAFLFGWTQLVLIRPSALGAIALIFAEYLGDFVPLDGSGVRGVSVAVIVAVGVVNMRSVRWGAVFENATGGAKVLALASLAVLALLVAGPLPASAEAGPGVGAAWSAYGIALVAALWAYDGWADLTFMAGEVRDPARTFPRALATGVLAVVVVYLLVNAAYLRALSVEAMAGSSLVAADVAESIAGTPGSLVVSGLVVVSTLGALNGAMMTGPRVFFAMASDGLMPRVIAAVHPRHGTPWASVALATLLGVAYVSVRSFEQLAGGFVLGVWPFYALAVGAVLLDRWRDPGRPRPYRVPGYPAVPLLFLVASIGILVAALLEAPALTLFGFGIIALGVPVFALFRGAADRLSAGGSGS
jgi:amino acid transporter